jgi:hypothetical protein
MMLKAQEIERINFAGFSDHVQRNRNAILSVWPVQSRSIPVPSLKC